MWRGEFPVLERTTYMISNSVGAMPRAVYEEMRAYANSWVSAVCAREILVDYRPKAGVGLFPHFYNREEECDLAIEQIAEILETRAWEKHAAAYSHA